MNTRLGDSLACVDALAASEGLSRAALIRVLVDEGLDRRDCGALHACARHRQDGAEFMPKQVPHLMRGGLSGRVYVVTRYRDLGSGTIEALEKFDVTEEFEAMSAPTAPREVPPHPYSAWTELGGPAVTEHVVQVAANPEIGQNDVTLYCTCGWNADFGSWPDLDVLTEAARRHREDCGD